MAEAAAALEQRCLQTPPSNDVAAPLAALQGAVDATRSAMAHAIAALEVAASAGAVVPSVVTDVPGVYAALKGLAVLLQVSDLQALQHFAEIRPALATVGAQQLGELELAVQGLQFEVAHTLCQAMLRQYAPTPPVSA